MGVVPWLLAGTWLRPAPVGVGDAVLPAVRAHPLVLPGALSVLQADPKVPRLQGEMLPQHPAHEGLLEPAMTRKALRIHHPP